LSWCCRALVALCGAILFAIGCESWAAGTHKRASSSRNLIAHVSASRDGDGDSDGGPDGDDDLDDLDAMDADEARLWAEQAGQQSDQRAARQRDPEY